MAYVNGSANDMAELRTALFNACTANGWTLSGEVLHKGGIYMRLQVVSAYLALLAGTGVDGSNNLTGAANSVARIGRPSLTATDITWPVSYEIFILTDPDEVYLVINYNVDSYQWLAWGVSTIDDLPSSGNWYAGSLGASTLSPASWLTMQPDAGGTSGTSYQCPGLFWLTSANNVGLVNAFVNHGLDGEEWNGTARIASAIAATGIMLNALPNAWNSESVLVPIQVWIPRSAGNKVSLIADLAHARHLRIDNHTPGELITLGPDTWKVFPCFRKDSSVRNGGGGITHTGTMGFAVRYDGP